MLSLEQEQAAMMQALDHGPDHLPDTLFAGTRARVIAGMKVHANTISHARLIALEETFPRTLAWMGQDQFNLLSRQYLEVPGVSGLALTSIGAGFSSFLGNQIATRMATDLARFEWAWLQSYHAAEAPPLRLADLAGLSSEALVDFAVKSHPAASIAEYDIAVCHLIGEEGQGLAEADAMLLTRPSAEVLIFAADDAMQAMFPKHNEVTSIGNLLGGKNEPAIKGQDTIDGVMQTLIALLDAGALTATASG